jgi:hypothetical protein
VPVGIVIALFNDRFTSPAWRFAGGIPGGYQLWAGALLVCGAVMLASLVGQGGPRRDGMLLAGMALAGLWWFILGGMFFTASIVARGNPLGAVAWWIICGFYWIWVFYERKRG